MIGSWRSVTSTKALTTSGIYACFEPELERRGFGTFTMLKEIEYSIDTGREFYYPGFAYEGPSFYDYKKRFAALETFDWKGNWFPYVRPRNLAADQLQIIADRIGRKVIRDQTDIIVRPEDHEKRICGPERIRNVRKERIEMRVDLSFPSFIRSPAAAGSRSCRRERSQDETRVRGGRHKCCGRRS